MKDYSDHVRVLKAVLEELSKDNIDDSRVCILIHRVVKRIFHITDEYPTTMHPVERELRESIMRSLGYPAGTIYGARTVRDWLSEHGVPGYMLTNYAMLTYRRRWVRHLIKQWAA